MIAEFGSFALVLGLAFAAAQFVLSAAARLRRSTVLAAAGEGAAVAAFAGVAIAFACLIHAFVTSDFSVANVAANSHTQKPLLYKVAGTWGSHEGSILLWCLILTGYGAAAATLGRGLPRGLKASMVATQGALGTVFLAYTVFASNPLARLPLDRIPVEGNSLNPLLQDPALAIHPPFLYSGYVGMSVVFSLAVAALIEGRVDAAWARWVRPWALAAWSLLTVGITLGAFWAYYELGWGGWWFWDPVENASFMPWLMATALLHSAIVTEKRGALAGWSLFLAIGAFTFSMLGAFLVRSGVLTSVHAFAVDPKRGVLLLIILGVTAGSAFTLFAWRAPKLSRGGVFAPISRESALVLNNILLAAATMTVMLGTLYPLIREAMTGEAISVGPPYFNLTFAPLMACLGLVLPAGPLLAWKRGDLAGVAQRLWAAALIALACGVGAYALVSPRKAFGALGIALGAWLVAGALTELAERTRAFRVSAGDSWRRLTGLPRGAWGMTLAHLGLGVFVLGACCELGWRGEAAEALPLGGSLDVAGYHLTLETVGPREGKNFDAERALIRVTKAGREICTGEPDRRFYPAGGQTISGIALCYRGASHLYMVLGERRTTAPDSSGRGGMPVWLIRAYWNPWASLIFLGPVIMALGGIASLSDRRMRLGVGRRREAQAAPATPDAPPPTPLRPGQEQTA
ncbi:heme lyase CcmF/NrfE family subunit [Phenylobacterium sp.]|uniref:heme lyase CcmF/NrfE family subunit n=1 Tax=Phenylobacterium sp. TaxID=1871053 RepID=UPI0011F416C1|nr:heme lyase CcmF/NrfE family subunit [Phenylobacterium sp.]THD59118.1 MAG: heme lyase CcmF/NrfE family subunit [Phenylobacterium sp.]